MWHGVFGTMNLLVKLMTPEFWMALYRDGQLGEWPPNILLAAITRLVVVGLIFLGAGVLTGLLRRLVARGLLALEAQGRGSERRVATLNGLLTSTLSYLVYFVAIILTLFTVGVTWKGLAPLLGAASVLGLAIGFGAQKLIRDIITGLFILGEGQFDVGDWVNIGGATGRIEEIGLRVTRMRDDQGRLYVIANGDINQVYNASRGPVKLSLDVVLTRPTSFEAAITLVRETAVDALAELELPASEDETAPTVAVAGIDSAKFTLRLVLWVPVAQRDQVENLLRQRLAYAVEAAQMALV
jgi:small-conductance mechanosensitive channel